MSKGRAGVFGSRFLLTCLGLGLGLNILGCWSPQECQADLKKSVDATLASSGLRGADIGVLVVRRSDGAVLYERNPDKGLIPASNQKLLTASAALDSLGSAYQFETVISASGAPDPNGAVDTLYLRGSGDPALTSEQFWRLSADLRRGGLQRVRGDLILDDSVFDRVPWNPVWGGVSSRAYHSPVGGVSANYGSFAVEVAPGQKAGDPALITLDPPVSYFSTVSKVVTGKPGSSARPTVDRAKLPANEEGQVRDRITVKGSIAAGGEHQIVYRSVSDPLYYAGALWQMQLEANGIVVEGKVRRGAVPESAQELLVFKGFPLSEVVHRFVKFSNNSIAESLVKVLGAKSTGQPGSWGNGIAALREQLQSLGVDVTGLVLEDGSGLSRGNRVSPRTFVQTLQVADRSFAWGPELIAALPIAGLDGTLKKRAKGASGLVRAKTGLLTGVTGLSGFVRSQDGEDLIFSILVNGYKQGDRAAMDSVDRFVEALAHSKISNH
jgi:D-alanyl-D-alanine carboxypeptidase/D-alanyl-D-alanine-endopeptidase (penicillin-binding protein 4)